ncbi:MAG: efflux RND transporter periplasmic adaptor subunit [Phycisphaerae bacterium]|nr:efflux RND transporter periplasmic adaptor subunit [Phycisphaerae bacterium]
MATERSTFHEAWYRVANLRPRLLAGVQVWRQHFRGQMWYVLEDPCTNKFSRISPEAYRFLGLLDGKRTVGEVWRLCNEHLGDNAPTQAEVIQLLGQLHCTNLLYAELAPDTESLFNRYRKRVRRQIQSFMTNILFVRIPLIDPDNFLRRWVHIFGLAFTVPGFLLWLIVLASGLYFVIGNLSELMAQSRDVLAPDNLIFLYLSLVVVKVLHEFCHAFACKRFGEVNGSGGQVHAMGVMFLVFVPLPYVDASSAWALRRKHHRAIVGMAGVMMELFLAAIAAIVWAGTSTGTVHIVAYNVIFVASISTLLFNGNPLLRFDAYYVLSDLIEIPNLSQRAKEYYYYLVRRYSWGLQTVRSPAHTAGERVWFVTYGLASTVYRIFISFRILFFLNDRLPDELFIIVPILACVSLVMWVLVPSGKFVHYLLAGAELTRHRSRAVISTAAVAILLVSGLGILAVPHYCRIEGFLEPSAMSVIHVETSGFAADFLPSDTTVDAGGGPLVVAYNPELVSREQALHAHMSGLQTRRRLAELTEIAAAQILDEQIQALAEQIERIGLELSMLRLQAPRGGMWISPHIERIKGMYLHRGEQVGQVADVSDWIVRGTAGQKTAALIVEQASEAVEMRIRKRPDKKLTGRIERIFPAGQEKLPSEALGYAAGGGMPTVLQDPSGTRAAEMFFEVRIRPERHSEPELFINQRVIVRIRLASKPLALQWWLSLRQLFQKRFHI